MIENIKNIKSNNILVHSPYNDYCFYYYINVTNNSLFRKVSLYSALKRSFALCHCFFAIPTLSTCKGIKKTDVAIIRFWDFTLNKRLVSYFTFVCQRAFLCNVNLRTVYAERLLLVCFLFVIFVFVFCGVVVLLLWGRAWGFACLFLA